MPADRLLSTLLRSLQTYTDQQDTPSRLLSTAATLLTTLTNPLNTTLLTRQLLTAPALWERPDGLRLCLRFTGVFHSAAVIIANHHLAVHENRAEPPKLGYASIGGGLSLEEWVRAVVKSADDNSSRWKHLMVLGGLLIGFESQEHSMLSNSLRSTLNKALIQATNLALEESRGGEELGAQCITLVLNHSFQYISDSERARLNYDFLLPVLVGTTFFSSEGLQSAYFIGAIDLDVVEVSGNKFNWPETSSSYQQIQRMVSRPLFTSMGPLSRLIAHAVEHVRDSWLIQTLVDDINNFAKALTTQWRQNKLSEIDISEEAVFLLEETTKTTLPGLWKALQTALFSTVIVLRAVIGRVLGDRILAADGVAPILATQTLHTLRNLYFISSRFGSSSFSQYIFVYLTAMDILSQYHIQSDAFIKDIRPMALGNIPKNPLDRCLDLYFLNTAEHFTLVLPQSTNENLLVAAATPYLAAGGNNHLLPIFEAAHSVMLAVLSAPQSAEITARHLPFYVDALFKMFPDNLSSRQFRLAFKTLVRVATPPSPLSVSQPDLPAILLELVHHRALHATTIPLKPDAALAANLPEDPYTPLSEQAVLALTLIDALPFLSLHLLEEWLPVTGELINSIPPEEMKQACRERFWEMLISGEMDAERSQICVAWWTTQGGRELVLFGEQKSYVPIMSGALLCQGRESKL
ncbi:hypothetical protein M501DRAFT_979132 [Patellaria atrata CBS 101060]|uniref:Peroxisomal membrane protein Pex17 n=1 Tax=Patellaria atrata CBS 101060 TaxID=1346257 RepID=A0A9P4S5S7_9PEZI|nr:hypothetical protein M501DRAFT_979132 [Patellaria atrata CBS 101060]